tara:strand:+ start:384 stop:557 length:174 start_codon:yes stop_codon:yes gene_type:complete
MEETKGTYDVFTVFEDVMASDLDEYQIKQLAMMLIANTLTEQTAKETAEVIVERCSK